MNAYLLSLTIFSYRIAWIKLESSSWLYQLLKLVFILWIAVPGKGVEEREE